MSDTIELRIEKIEDEKGIHIANTYGPFSKVVTTGFLILFPDLFTGPSDKPNKYFARANVGHPIEHIMFNLGGSVHLVAVAAWKAKMAEIKRMEHV